MKENIGELERGLKTIGKAICIVGLASVSVYAWHISDGKIGEGWATLAFITWLL